MTEPKKKTKKKLEKASGPRLAPTGVEEGDALVSEGGPHEDDEGVWHDLDDPPLVCGPHADPDDPAHVYDEDEPWYSDSEEGWDEERRDD